MKRIVSTILIFTFVFSLSGCGAAAKPEDTVNGFLSAAKELNLEEMATYVNSDSAEDLSQWDSEDDMEQYFLDYLKECASKMTYEIKSTNVTDNTAVVTVDFKYIDSTPLLKAVIGGLFTKALANAFSGTELTDEQELAMFTDEIQKQKSTISDSYAESTVDINCIKTDGKWFIRSVSQDLQNVVMANFICAANDIFSSFGEGDSDKADASVVQEPIG